VDLFPERPADARPRAVPIPSGPVRLAGWLAGWLAAYHPAMYQPIFASRSERLRIRHADYHLRLWGPSDPARRPLVLAHGWMDVSASFQFMVDALLERSPDRRIVAPDWRGFGRTRAPATDGYWFPDYLADLDALLDRIAPGGMPVDLLGHSMGGHAAMLYAGVRPHRVRRLINLEGFGLPAAPPSRAVARYREWMDGIAGLHRGTLAMGTYPDADAVAARLVRNNPRLPAGRAAWLAREWAAPFDEASGEGPWRILADAAHKVANAQAFRLDEVLAVYAEITAPVLAVEAEDGALARAREGYGLAQWHARLASVRDGRIARIDRAGHMVHHDRPDELAALTDAFLQ
jgi:pimeloyl-ACP methyl ester carboxylesterase